MDQVRGIIVGAVAHTCGAAKPAAGAGQSAAAAGGKRAVTPRSQPGHVTQCLGTSDRCAQACIHTQRAWQEGEGGVLALLGQGLEKAAHGAVGRREWIGITPQHKQRQLLRNRLPQQHVGPWAGRACRAWSRRTARVSSAVPAPVWAMQASMCSLHARPARRAPTCHDAYKGLQGALVGAGLVDELHQIVVHRGLVAVHLLQAAGWCR